MSDPNPRHALVFALAHEIGNQLAGIRLEAHLLDESLGPAGLARAALAIDGLAGQAAPLLALLRPLLAPEARRIGAASCAGVLEAVRRELEAEGTGGHPIVLDVAADADRDAPAIEGLHALLRALIGAPGDLRPPRQAIRLGLVRAGRGVAVVCDLPGDVLADAVGSGEGAGGGGRAPLPAHALRGRPLAWAVARLLVEDAGGRIELAVGAGRSRVVLQLPGAA
ncbi:MAG: hypothetical protein R3F35_13705 [Myxococcota bacterium]